MNPEDLEHSYELLASHIDRFDEALAPVFLAKVAVLMAAQINDVAVVRQCIEAAGKGLDQA